MGSTSRRRALTTIVGTTLALAMTVGPAVAGTEVVVSESFRNAAVTDADGWFVTFKGGPSTPSFPAKPCLTAGTNTAQTPIPGCQNPAIDPPGSGVLRLTATSGGIGLLASRTELDTARGLDATFKLAQWGGTGADGIVFFFSTFVPNPGGGGGALGYEPGGAENGLGGALLGIGFDAFGNFSQPRAGCPSPDGPGQQANRVVARGPGSGMTGYCFIANSGPLAQPLHAATRAASTRTGHVVFDPATGIVTVSLDGVTVLQIPAPQELLTSQHFFVGFTASTGGAQDNHEVWDLEVRAEAPASGQDGQDDEVWSKPSAVLPQAIVAEPTFTG